MFHIRMDHPNMAVEVIRGNGFLALRTGHVAIAASERSPPWHSMDPTSQSSSMKPSTNVQIATH